VGDFGLRRQRIWGDGIVRVALRFPPHPKTLRYGFRLPCIAAIPLILR
jgi:hypothetical protein